MREIIATCPYRKCNKSIFRNGELKLAVDIKNPLIFLADTKCPNCGNLVKLSVEIRAKTEPVYGN